MHHTGALERKTGTRGNILKMGAENVLGEDENQIQEAKLV